MMALAELKELAAQLRVDSIRCTTAAGSGHPTSALSAADMMAVLLANYLRYDWKNPTHANNDRLIFSKGHACPLLYAMYRAVGVINDKELLSLRKPGSRLQGHPNPRVLPYVDVATGSLGMGLAIGVGMAIAGKKIDESNFKVWVLLGDSEMAEGSVWEAFEKASHYKLDNLIAFVDMNRLGQRGPTALGWNPEVYSKRINAFGWKTITIDGHNLTAIDQAIKIALETKEQPTCIIAKTQKGAGVDEVADKDNWHGKAFPSDLAERAITALGGIREKRVENPKPLAQPPRTTMRLQPLKLPKYEPGSKEATRKAYGDTIAALALSRPEVVALDAEVSNSTYSDQFARQVPDRFFEMYIAEQNMVSAANGMAVMGKRAFASTFAAFLTRAYDQIRMAAIAGANLCLSGSHAGVSIGEDGPSQMALEDLAMMRAIFESTVLYPSDPNQTAYLVSQMADLPGISYIRTTREKLPVIYQGDDKFLIGGSRVLRQSKEDKAAVVAAGITVHEALKAYDQLQKEGISIRVIDAYSIKPIDRSTMHLSAKECGTLITVEDHWPEGGLGDAVLDAFTGKNSPKPNVIKLGVNSMPGSASPMEMLHSAGISAEHIVNTVKSSM